MIAAVTNLVISAIARGPLGASDDFVPLTAGPVLMWTLLGAIIGAVGWRLIVNTSARSRALLTTLVPTVLVLSLIPDVALLATDSTAGQTTAGVVALMVMHVVTAVIAVTAYRKAMPRDSALEIMRGESTAGMWDMRLLDLLESKVPHLG